MITVNAKSFKNRCKERINLFLSYTVIIFLLFKKRLNYVNICKVFGWVKF